MAEKTLKGMTRSQLLAAFEEAIANINIVEKKRDEIVKIRASLDEGGLLSKIRDAQSESATSYSEINEYHKKIFTGDETSEAIKSGVEKLVEDFNGYHEGMEELINEMHGYNEESEEGGVIEHAGYIDKMKKTFHEYEKNHDRLLKKIETELLSGATTVILAKNFNDEVAKYKKTRTKWEIAFVLCAVGILVLFSNFLWIDLPTGEESIYYFVHRMPFFGILVWLAVFIGNRRAENKKLEESYKHKEVMAKSFAGYKKSIRELGDDDKTLLTKLMKDLLDAIKKDSSNFLSSKGESHPVVDAVKQSNADE